MEKCKKLLLQASGCTCHYFVACQFLPELHEFRGGQTHTLIISLFSLARSLSLFNSVCFLGMTFNHKILTNHSVSTGSGTNKCSHITLMCSNKATGSH